ncbi:MAG: efflux RND transporter periplasmic adaptor subunit [Pseudomonadota bacterium]
MKKSIWIAAGAVVLIAGSVILVRHARAPKEKPRAEQVRKHRYQCSMHPGIVTEQPGNCPICNMALQEVDESVPPSQVPAQEQVGPSERKILFYRHPMRPDVTSRTPAKDEMGMDYVPVYEDEAKGGGSSIAGHATITVPTERQQLIGVTTEKVERRDLDLEIRSVGRVAFDPELYNAMAEYREAITAKEGMKESPWATAREESANLIKSSALKLRLLGLSDSQIRQITQGGSESLNLLLPGKTVWVYGQVYEYEVDLLRRGQRVIVTTPAIPGRSFHGTVKSIDPVLNAMTRTVRVRAEIKTPDERLRPETFVNIKIQIPLGKVIVVPDGAILSTGETQIVFVKKGGGEFEPRDVVLGREAEGFYEVIRGVSEGEEVVTSANFLIDSESRFKAAVNAFVKKNPSSTPSEPSHAGH